MVASPFVLRATGLAEDMAPDWPVVTTALAALVDPEHTVQLQALPSGRMLHVPGGDHAALTEAVRELARGSPAGVYLTINPLAGQKGSGPSGGAWVADMACRRWFLIDVDRTKEPATKELSATDDEKTEAWKVAHACADFLLDLGWPVPFVVDSGNGAHLYYRIDLPNDEASRDLLRDLLKALAGRFDSMTANVDTKTHNANRLSKLPGTWARKGPHSPERPHRLCRIVSLPGQMEVVSINRIRAALEALEAHGRANGHTINPLTVRATNERQADLEARAIAWLAKADEAVSGEDGHSKLFHAARGVVYGFDLGQDVGFRLLWTYYNPTCRPEWSEREIRHKVEEADTVPYSKLRGFLRDKPNGNTATTPVAPPVPEGESVIVWASEILTRTVEWLWLGRIPLGKLTTFAGVGGLGKTFVLLDIAARVSTGAPWPDQPGISRPPGKVLFISGEDDADDTLVPRLVEMGGDRSRVAFLKTQVLDRFTLADLKTLDRAIADMGDGVRYVAIDPPTAYLGGVNDHNNAELRGLLSPLKNWAAKHSVALIFNTHLTKPSAMKTDAMMRVMGSVAWVNAVRAAHLFIRDQEDPERRFFVGMKNNLAKEISGLAYKIILTTSLARVDWLGAVDVTADEAINKSRQRKRNVVAADWLASLFDGRVEIPSKEIWQRKKDETTLSDDALKEGKELLGIRAAQKTDDEGVNCWWWVWTAEAKAAWRRKQEASDGELL